MLNFIFETEPIIEVQNEKILLFDFIVFFSCAMNQESGGSVVITMPEKTEAVRAITDFEKAIQSPYPVLHPLNQKTHVPVKQSSSASLLQAIIQKD